MPERAQGELAEALRRVGSLSAEDFDRLLARAITEMNGWAECALLLTLAERQPSEAVKQALFYRCNFSEETSASCAAMLCFLCGKAVSPFDNSMANFFAQFGLHVNYFQRRDALEKLTEMTGYAGKEVDDFARIERDFHEQPPAVVPLPTAPATPVTAVAPPPPPAPPLSDTPLSDTAGSAANASRPQAGVAGPAALGDVFEITSEMRGETIHYTEPMRTTSMQFFWTRGYQIHADTITHWSYPADGRVEPVSARQRVGIVERVVEYAREKQHVAMEVVNADWMHAELRREEIAAMREMENELRRSTNDPRVFVTLAHKWKDRVKQLVAAGQIADAVDAYHRGVMWATQYTGGAAEAGGAGSTVSQTRDEAVAELRDALGNARPGDDRAGDRARAAIGEGVSE